MDARVEKHLRNLMESDFAHPQTVLRVPNIEIVIAGYHTNSIDNAEFYPSVEFEGHYMAIVNGHFRHLDEAASFACMISELDHWGYFERKVLGKLSERDLKALIGVEEVAATFKSFHMDRKLVSASEEIIKAI